MIAEKKGGCCSPKVLIFTPVIAAIFAAISYYYFQYSYARFVSVNFTEWVLYTSDSLFLPEHDKYKLVFYSSNIQDQYDFVKHLPKEEDEMILAIDFHQNRSLPSSADRFYVTSGANTVLSYLLQFKVSQLPTIVWLERDKNKHDRFRQSSPSRVVSSGEIKLVLQSVQAHSK